MRETRAGVVETITALAILIAVVSQTWVVLNDASCGRLGEQALDLWNRRFRGRWENLRLWFASQAETERMIVTEVMPYLDRSRHDGI